MGVLTVTAMVAAAEIALAAVAKKIGVNHVVLKERFGRLAHNVIESGGEAAAKRLGDLTVAELCHLLAHGPTEQTRAVLSAEQVHPVEHQGPGGFAEPPHAAVEGEGGEQVDGRQ